MGTIDYVGISLIILALVVFFVRNNTGKKTTQAKKNDNADSVTSKTLGEAKKWSGKAWSYISKENWWKPLVCVAVLHVILAVFFHETSWYGEYVWNKWMVIAQVAIAVIYILPVFRKEVTNRRDKSKKMVLNGWGWVVMIIVLAGLGYKLWIQPQRKPQEQEVALTPIPQRPVLSLPGHNPKGELRAREFWGEHANNEEDLETMMEIIRRESNFNHYERDGKTPLIGRINPDDRGMHQINTKMWQAEQLAYPEREVLGNKISEIDFLTPEGGNLVALYLYERYEFRPWNASLSQGPQREVNNYTYIVAPTGGEWSSPVDTGRNGIRWTQIGKKRVQLTTSHGRTVTLNPENQERLVLGKMDWIKFRSLEEEPETFKIEYK